MSLLQDYLEGVDPRFANSGLRITAFASGANGANSLLTFTSTTARMYNIESNTDVRLTNGWVDAGLGLFAPDAGAQTTRMLVAAPQSKIFYRVKAVRPLP
jgi:hypothetical protein